jgi:hypothetical protein
MIASLEEVVRLMQGQDVRHIVIGGWAAIIHGNARSTNDVDPVVQRICFGGRLLWLLWFPNSVWEPPPRNSVSHLLGSPSFLVPKLRWRKRNE